VLPHASPRSVFGGDDEAHRGASARAADALTPAAIAVIEAEIIDIARHAEAWPRGHPFKLRVRLRDVADEVWVRLVLRPGDEARATRRAWGQWRARRDISSARRATHRCRRPPTVRA
jgi:hypothetical protein